MKIKRSLRVVSCGQFLLLTLVAVILCGIPARPMDKAPLPRVVFSALGLGSQGITSGASAFARPSPATYFDPRTNAIMTANPQEPRFMFLPGKPWGVSNGLLLEGEKENLLLDSSFELGAGKWEMSPGAQRSAGAGLHGAFGVRVEGPAFLTHAPVTINVYPSPWPYSYWLSLYVRADDGQELATSPVSFQYRPAGHPHWLNAPHAAIECMGHGSWHRAFAKFDGVAPATGKFQEAPATNAFEVRFYFKSGRYMVDAAQMETSWAGEYHHRARYDTPSSYIPTYSTAVTRASDVLWAPVTNLFSGPSWSYSFWYGMPLPLSNRELRGKTLFSVWAQPGRDSPVILSSATGTAGVRADKPKSEGWTFITVTYDGTNLDLFHDGVSSHTAGGPVKKDLRLPAAGRAYWSAPWLGGYFSPMGLISDFVAWDRALTPAEVKGLCLTGQPLAQEPPPPTGIPVRFKTGGNGRVSINIYAEAGTLVCQLLIGKEMPAGEHCVYWDGCDDAGRPVPVGAYVFKGLVSNVRSIWDAKVANTSPSEGGEWLQYRTGHYYDLVAMTNGGLVTISSWGEHGRVIQRLDGPPDYPVRWSAEGPWPAFGIAAAADSNFLYLVFSHRVNTNSQEMITRFRLDGNACPYDTAMTNVSLKGALRVSGLHDLCWYIDALTDNRNPYLNKVDVCGLAAHDGKLYVPHYLENRIDVLDAASGATLASFPCPPPRKVALDSAGRILATSGRNVIRFDADGAHPANIVTNLSDGCGIAVGNDDRILVSDLGDSQQVKLFSARGQPLKTYGRQGGHKGGVVAPDILDAPVAVAFGAGGAIFVADLGGFRVLALNADFSLRKEIHGRMPYQLSFNYDDPTRVYFGWSGGDMMEYTIDYDRKTSRVSRRWDRQQPELKGWPFGRSGDPAAFHRFGKRQFVYRSGFPGRGAVAEIVDDRLVPRCLLGFGALIPACTISNVPGWQPSQVTNAWVWHDRNADGRIAASEFEFGHWPLAARAGKSPCGVVSDKGDFYRVARDGIIKIPLEDFDKHGLPIYHWKSACYALEIPADMQNKGNDGKLYPVCPAGLTLDQAGNFYVFDRGDVFSKGAIPIGIIKFSPEGRLVWRVGRRQPGTVWRPGDINWCGPAGIVDDRYLFSIDYRGEMNVWDTDGLWVARLFADLPDDLFLPGETFQGAAFRHANGKVYAYSSPDCVYRAARIVVDGLDRIERFAGVLRVNERAVPRPEISANHEWRLLPRRNPIEIDGEINPREWGTDTDTQAPERFYHNDAEAARAWAQWDDEALYLCWKISDHTPALNRYRGDEKWKGDQVEFMIRASSETAAGGVKFSEDEFQIAIGPDADGKVNAVVQRCVGELQGKELSRAQVALQVLPDRSGYTMEARIPWAELGTYRPAQGDKLRWNMVIDWGDSKDERCFGHHSKWQPGIHFKPNSWGLAVLE